MKPGRSQREFSLWREDLLAGLASLALVAGLYLDGWNHINLQNGALGGFFTPWHGLLYAGFALSAAWVLTRNPHLYRRGVAPTPTMHRIGRIRLRYPLAVAGLVIANVGLLGDIGWHTAFGEETGVARVIAPFHLILFFGASLLVTAPLRSGWHAPRDYPEDASLARLLPPLLSLTLLTALIAFMFQWLSAFVDWSPALQLDAVPQALASDPRVGGTVEYADVARILVTNVVFLAPVFAVLRRWRLPFGSVTLMWTVVVTGLEALSEFQSAAVIAAAFVGGLTADVVIASTRQPARHALGDRLVGTMAPVALWGTYFAALAVVHHRSWPLDLSLGTTGVAALTGLALSFVARPIALPAAATT